MALPKTARWGESKLLPLRPYPHGSFLQIPAQSAIPLTASEYKKKTLVTGMRASISSCQHLAPYFTIFWGGRGIQQQKRNTGIQNWELAWLTLAWVDLGTQATENVLTAAVGADSEGPV